MPEKTYGFNEDGFKRVKKTVHKSERRLPDVGRRTRRVQTKGRLGTQKMGKTDAAHAIYDYGTISIWSGAAADTLTDTTVNIEDVYNHFATLEEDTWVILTLFPWGWELSTAGCEPDP